MEMFPITTRQVTTSLYVEVVTTLEAEYQSDVLQGLRY